MFHPLLPIDVIRTVEEGVMASDSFPDETMQKAAMAVAETAQWVVEVPGTGARTQEAPGADGSPVGNGGSLAVTHPAVIIVAGSGGNGGDALYAGAVLVQRGWHAVAVCVGSSVHERAFRVFDASGGVVLRGGDAGESGPTPDNLASYRAQFSSLVVIDGATGIGGSGPLRDEPAAWMEGALRAGVPVVAVDVPSGIDADTGVAHTPHVVAAATVTFGAFRRAHALNSDCGVVLQADCGLRDACSRQVAAREARGLPVDYGVRAVAPPSVRGVAVPEGMVALSQVPGVHVSSCGRSTVASGMVRPTWPAVPLEPGAHDDKYTGGVVGVRAGSAEYPGAAVLCTTAAVRATSAMVRFAGECRGAVVAANPEIVAADDIASSGRVQAWVVGPGGGVDRSGDDVRAVLAGTECCPVVIDADGVTALCQRGGVDGGAGGYPLIRAVREYAGSVVLTPHAGEFRRLVRAVLAEPSVGLSAEDRDALSAVFDGGDGGGVGYSRCPAVSAVARALHCVVMVKGRSSVVAAPGESSPVAVRVVDAGCSWAATPGSGDVFSGLVGALVAECAGRGGADLSLLDVMDTVVRSVVIHAAAADSAAETMYGYAPTSAARIAEAIPQARARLQW
ncbi:bifunctional ADP-dependent NAD(P)H-hydrate dehydratase/NAD(P)H-hydrate epimerase [Corynebacterium kroppenstedtii]|uniref:bifunctional ADP-dependent NAD(P)H-hydrate dehydratase/NAD(P)H-hydrate epimerase n=1 Tax=Corynebacterium sp. PCR 32 TaxID=3351342 RepID=UPI003098891A